MGRLGRDPAFFDHVEGSVADHVARRIGHAGIDLDPAENPYLHWILKGTHGAALPLAWRAEHFETIRARLDRLDIRHGALETFVATGEKADGFNLSDIFEYMTTEAFEAVYGSLIGAAKPDARLVYWNMMVPRRMPAAFASRVRRVVDAEERGKAIDKAFFYSDFVVEAGRMSVLAQLGLIVVSVAMLLVVMAAVKTLGSRYAWSAELQRKCVHVATGLYALTLPLTFSERWPVLVLIGMAGAVMLTLRLPRFAKSGFGSTLHGVERKSYGELLLALSVGFIFCFSLDNPVLYVLPITVLTLSDAAAAMIGTRYGRRLFAVEAGTKSLEGVAMFFLVTWIVAMVLLLLMTDIGRVNVVLLSLVDRGLRRAGRGRFLARLRQSLRSGRHPSVPGEPPRNPAAAIAAAGVGFHHDRSSPSSCWRRGSASRTMRARAYTVLVFLICAVTAPHNAILPVTAVLAHLAARQRQAVPKSVSRPRFPRRRCRRRAVLAVRRRIHRAQFAQCLQSDLRGCGARVPDARGRSPARARRRRGRAPALRRDARSSRSWNPASTQWHGTLWPWVVGELRALPVAFPLVRPASARPLSRAARARRLRCRCRSRFS